MPYKVASRSAEVWQLTGTSHYPLEPYRPKAGCFVQCISPFVAQMRPQGMSALRSLSGAKRTSVLSRPDHDLSQLSISCRPSGSPSDTPCRRGAELIHHEIVDVASAFA